MENSEISFKNTLSILNEERNKALCLSGANMHKMMHLIDILIRRVIDAMDKPVEDVILIGSTIEVELVDGDGFKEIIQYQIGRDFSSDDMLSFYSPLGSNIIGKTVNSITEYEVNDYLNKAKVLSVENEKGKQKLLTNN